MKRLSINQVLRARRLTAINHHTEAAILKSEMIGDTWTADKLRRALWVQRRRGYVPSSLRATIDGLEAKAKARAKQVLSAEDFDVWNGLG